MTTRGTQLAAMLGVLLLGCAHGHAPAAVSTISAERFYPLGLGREWTYDAQLLGEHRVFTVRILKEQDGYFVDSQGGQIRAGDDGVRDRERYLLRNPVQEGKSWTNVLSPDSQEQYKIDSAGAPCQATAGHFDDCVVVVGRTLVGVQNDALVNRMTFAKDVGLIRSEVLLERAGQQKLQSRIELKSYLAPPAAP